MTAKRKYYSVFCCFKRMIILCQQWTFFSKKDEKCILVRVRVLFSNISAQLYDTIVLIGAIRFMKAINLM